MSPPNKKIPDHPAEDTAPLASSGQVMRQQAEETARIKAINSPEDVKKLSPEEIGEVLHELRVHQIELEMQNEELRRTQVELDAARARYFDLYDLAPVGYVTISEKGLILEANLTAAGLLGVTRSALGQQIFTRFILKEDQDAYYLQRKQLFETGTPQFCELRMVKNDGTVFWAHLAATVAQDANGAPVCRVALSDISELKRAEEALLEGEDKFKYVFDNSAAGNSITLPSGEIQVNKAFCEMLDYSPEELQNKKWQGITHPDDIEMTQREVDKLNSGEKAVARFTKRFLRKDRSVVWADVSTSLRRDKVGKPLYFMTTLVDITERKQAEVKASEQMDELRRWQDATLGREGRVLVLKHEVNELLAQSSQPPRYPSAETENQ